LDYSYENNPGRTFNEEGDHKVALDLYDNGGIQKNSSVTIIVYPKPEARFEASPENEVVAGNEVIFHNRSLNGVSFRWDFGDGTSSEQFEPKHVYANPGNYNVRLLVTSDYGCTDSVTLVKGIVKEK
jgi:PKD repeat protein